MKTVNGMDQAQQKAKYAVGTIVAIAGDETKAANGRFVISHQLVDQPDGEAHFLWRRLGKEGKVLAGNSTANLRGNRCTYLETFGKIVGTMEMIGD
jgi:hypothetical protein